MLDGVDRNPGLVGRGRSDARSGPEATMTVSRRRFSRSPIAALASVDVRLGISFFQTQELFPGVLGFQGR